MKLVKIFILMVTVLGINPVFSMEFLNTPVTETQKICKWKCMQDSTLDGTFIFEEGDIVYNLIIFLEEQLNDKVTLVYRMGRKFSPNDTLDDSATYFISLNNASIELQMCRNLIPPDLEEYRRSLIMIPEHSGDWLAKIHHKKMIKVQIKIIREEDNCLVIKFNDRYQINWGSGPTAPSLYALLFTSINKISPIYFKKWDMEKSLISEPIIKQYAEFDYELVTHEECIICLDAECAVLCDNHEVACLECSLNLSECPICRKTGNFLEFQYL